MSRRNRGIRRNGIAAADRRSRLVVRGRGICALGDAPHGPKVFRAELMDQLYDIAIVGGGLAGSALAKSMAEKRFRVIVLEREKEFRDRVRGEQMACWGVAEARELGIYEHLVN